MDEGAAAHLACSENRSVFLTKDSAEDGVSSDGVKSDVVLKIIAELWSSDKRY
jgi:hypothetical protein